MCQTSGFYCSMLAFPEEDIFRSDSCFERAQTVFEGYKSPLKDAEADVNQNLPSFVF